jgi:ribosome biogenesis GTPase A
MKGQTSYYCQNNTSQNKVALLIKVPPRLLNLHDFPVFQIIPTVAKLVSSSDRYNRSEEKDFSVMVIGVPNVGKSSLINALRSKYLGRGMTSLFSVLNPL